MCPVEVQKGNIQRNLPYRVHNISTVKERAVVSAGSTLLHPVTQRVLCRNSPEVLWGPGTLCSTGSENLGEGLKLLEDQLSSFAK